MVEQSSSEPNISKLLKRNNNDDDEANDDDDNVVQQQLHVNNKTAWNSEIESFLKNIGEQAAGYQWMHEKSASFFGTITKLVTLGIIILGAVITFILTSTLFSQLETPYILIPVGIANVMEILLIIFIGIIKTFGLEQREARHNSRMNHFASLYNHIRRELSYYRKDRKYGPHFLSLAEQQFAFYKIAGPDIPGFIEWRYRRVLRRERSRLAKVGQISNEINIRDQQHHYPLQGDNLLPPKCNIAVSSSDNEDQDETQKQQQNYDIENQNLHLQPAPRFEDPYNRFQIDRYFEL